MYFEVLLVIIFPVVKREVTALHRVSVVSLPLTPAASSGLSQPLGSRMGAWRGGSNGWWRRCRGWVAGAAPADGVSSPGSAALAARQMVKAASRRLQAKASLKRADTVLVGDASNPITEAKASLLEARPEQMLWHPQGCFPG